MTDQASTAELSAEEVAYFESGGETLPQELTTEPEVGTQPEPEQVTQPEQTAQDRDEKGRFVPHQALHAEREEHKKTKAGLEEVQRNLAVMNDRWNTLLQLRQQQEQPVAPQPPDPDQDIFAAFKYQADQLKALQDQFSTQQKQTEEQKAAETQDREVWNAWSQDATAYAAQNPDFGPAIEWLSSFRSKQLQSLALVDERFSAPDAVQAQINAELRSIVIAARQKGLSPAKVVHDMAVTYGFQAKAQDPAIVTMPDKLATVASAQAAAKTVGQAPGRAGGDALTPESIAAMSPAEFERWASDKNNSRLLDQMLGA